MTWTLRILQTLLGLMFLGSGGSKLAGAPDMVDDFDRFRYPQWFRVITGAVEVGGATGLLLGFALPALTPLAGALLATTMTGAVATHKRVEDPTSKVMTPAVLLGLLTLVGVMRQKELSREHSKVQY